MDNFLNILGRLVPDSIYISLMYYYHFHRLPNLHHPKTFNEKLQWLKLHDRRPEYTALVDKLLAKEFAGNLLGVEHIIPTLGAWERAEEIDFDALPNQFVLKCNHDSGSVFICRDKAQLNRKTVIEEFNKDLHRNGYWYGRERPYKNVQRKVFAENYIENADSELTDYKVHCFHGQPRLILVCQGRFQSSGMREDFYSENWEWMDLSRPDNPRSDNAMEKPIFLDQILKYAKKLSAGLPFVRTDFYVVDERVIFGELTFYPASGFKRFVPQYFDDLFGSWLTLLPDLK